MAQRSDEIANAIYRDFTSPNVEDQNLERANVLDALNYIALALQGPIAGAIHRNAEAMEMVARAVRDSRE